MATDYQGLATLVASLTASFVTIVTLIRQGRLKDNMQSIEAGQGHIRENVQKIEIATNSMKDALVQATRGQALLEGASKERADQEARKALKAQGVVESDDAAEKRRP